jgi:hypothetical protein
MFYKRIAVLTNKDLYIHKIPDTMTNDEIVAYLQDLGQETTFFEVNNVITKEVSMYRYKQMFPSQEFLGRTELIKEYLTKHKSRDASWIQMKSFICKWLYNKGLTMMDIAQIMGYANHTSIIYFIKEYSDFDKGFRFDDFMQYVEQGLYPVNVNGITKFKEL